MSSPIIPMLLLTGATGSGRYLLVKILAKYNGVCEFKYYSLILNSEILLHGWLSG